MTTLITSGESTIAPTQILGYMSSREAGNITHQILGRPSPDITIRPAALRTGTLELGFEGADSEWDSKVAADLFATGALCAIVSTERGSVEMVFAPGRVMRDLEDTSRDAWVVGVDFTETEDTGVAPLSFGSYGIGPYGETPYGGY